MLARHQTAASQRSSGRSQGLARRAMSIRAAAAKPLTGPCVVRMKATHSTSTLITPSQDKDASLQNYMAQAAENFTNIQLPLGGKISRVDGTHVELVVPRIQLFDVWLQPRAIAELTTFPGRIEFGSQTEDVGLDGSHHVKEFRLDERFNLDVHITFHWRDASGNSSSGESSSDEGMADSSTIYANGTLMIEVDIPPPFSFLPHSVLESAGNTAVAGTMSIIMSAFTSSLARDYNLWSQDAALRQKRQQQLAAPAVASSVADAS